MKSIYTRRTVLSDIPYVYEICLKTGDDGKDASDLLYNPYLMGHYYAAPYLAYRDGVCFVAEYEYRPQGYIVAVPDTEAFNRWLETVWLPPLRERYSRPFPPEIIRSPREERILETIHRNHISPDTDAQSVLKNYPAHLHIDLLPSLQGKGMGRILMNNLCDELRGRRVKGLHLGVGKNNAGAIAFYQKLGFTILEEKEWGCMMGKTL